MHGGPCKPAHRHKPPQPGETLELTCSDLAFGGEGICRLEGGFVVFVDRALPGERLLAQVLQSKRSFARASKLRSLAPYDDAAEPVCEHFGPCGGCTLQSLAYDAQLAAKQRQVADLLSRTAGVADVAAVLRPAVGCPPAERLGYRNKMEFSFSSRVWQPVHKEEKGSPNSSSTRGAGSSGSRRGGEQRSSAGPRGGGGSASGGFALGLHRPGSTAEVLPVSRCHLQSDAANALLQRILALCRQAGLRPFDPHTGQGLLQDVVIRRDTPNTPSRLASSGSGSGGSGSGSAAAGGAEEAAYLINFVTARDGRQALAPVAAALMQPGQPGQAALPPAPAVVGVVNSVSQRGRPAGERRLAAEHVLAGRGSLTETLCGVEFEVSANSFFQTNTRQAEVLYRLVGEAAGLRPGDTLLDLYCGTGSIGLTLAHARGQLYGVEVNPAAVRDAQRNAARNGIGNATFLQGDLQKLQLAGRLPRPDVVVVDPARPGLPPLVIEYLRGCGARRVVYVSCNAATQARDIRALCSASESGGAGGAERSSGRGTGDGDATERGVSSSATGSGGPFRLVSVQAVDLYPQTHHVETVAVLDALGLP
ncbi:hypothetical protein ABPG75_005524 [Micractinium tetrahymenae]